MKSKFLILCLVFFAKSEAQYTFNDVAEKYFRFNPYTEEFSKFFTRLRADTSLKEPTFQRRSADKPFLFTGFYNTFNPFRFKATDVNITLGDLAIDYSKINDSIKLTDTVLQYTINAFTGEGFQYKAVIQKELEWFHKRIGRDLGDSKYHFFGSQNNITGESYSYFLPGSIVAPLVVGWNKLEDSDGYFMSVTFLIKVRQNLCGLPDPFY